MEELDNRVNIIKENRCKTMKYEGLECVEVDSIVDTRIGKVSDCVFIFLLKFS